MRFRTVLLVCAVLAAICSASWAADNALTDKEKADGWKLLFDGTTTTGWHTSPTKTSWVIEDGVLATVPAGGDNLVTNDQFGNYLLSVDFKEGAKTNSGVFLRVPLKATKGCRGIEIQIFDQKNGKDSAKHACGAVYDATAPTKNMCKGPGVWQNVLIDCQDNIIKVTLNGTLVTTMNLDEWTVAGKAPDGSPNKFNVAYKDMPRVGQIALQNHKTKVWFKNIKIKVLDKSTK